MRASAVATRFGLLFILSACGSAPTLRDKADSDTESAALSSDTIGDLGPIAPCEVRVVSYTSSPRYRAFSFAAKAGDRADFWVRSADGDALAYILRSDHSNLARNDDADATTHDSHVTATLPSDGTYYVAFKELKDRAAHFTVTAGCSAPPAGATMVALAYHGETERQELHTFDPVTMQHSLLTALPDVRSIGITFSDEERGIAYFTGTGDGGDVYRMYGVDTKTGAILSNVPMPPFSYDSGTGTYHGYNFGAGIHPMPDGSYVTVTWNGDAAREEVHTVDPTTMQHTFVAAIDGVKWTSNWFTDKERGIAYFWGQGDDGVDHLYGIDGKTGAVVSRPVNVFTYDSSTRRYHGFNFGAGFHPRADGSYVTITWNGDANQEEIRTVNPATLEHSFLAVMGGITSTGGWFTDTARGVAYFMTSGEGSTYYLNGVDMKTGAMVSRSAMPEFVYDATTGKSRGYAFGTGFFPRLP